MDTRKSGQTAAVAQASRAFLLYKKHRTLASGVKQRGYRFKTVLGLVTYIQKFKMNEKSDRELFASIQEKIQIQV